MLVATLVFVLALVGLLTIGGLAVVMAVGAIMPKRSPVTSWPQNEEMSFASYEQRSQASHSRAWMVSIVSGVIMFVAAVGVYKGVAPDIKDLSKDMNMSNLTKKSSAEKAAAPKAEAPKAEESKAEAPKAEAEAPKAE